MDNLEKNNQKEKLDIILYFLNASGIKCSNIQEINGIIIPREYLLNDQLYQKLKEDIPKLKNCLSSTTFTSVQKNASTTQKWPLINLIRQILRKYNYELLPKRVCDGYSKDGIKKYKRLFEIILIKDKTNIKDFEKLQNDNSDTKTIEYTKTTE